MGAPDVLTHFMKQAIYVLLLSAVAALADANPPLVATTVTTDGASLIPIPYDAKKLTAELAFYPEVPKTDFYYLNLALFPRAHVQGTATLSTGQTVEWFHYECGGLYLRFKDGSERYFLHPITVAEMRASKRKEHANPK